MNKEFKNLYVVNYDYYNRVSTVIFAGTLDAARKFVDDIVSGLECKTVEAEDVSSIEIVDLSQGYYYAPAPDEELTSALIDGRLSKFVYVNKDEMFDGSNLLEEGTYYLPLEVSAVCRYTLEADKLAQALYPESIDDARND